LWCPRCFIRMLYVNYIASGCCVSDISCFITSQHSSEPAPPRSRISASPLWQPLIGFAREPTQFILKMARSLTRWQGPVAIAFSKRQWPPSILWYRVFSGVALFWGFLSSITGALWGSLVDISFLREDNTRRRVFAFTPQYWLVTGQESIMSSTSSLIFSIISSPRKWYFTYEVRAFHSRSSCRLYHNSSITSYRRQVYTSKQHAHTDLISWATARQPADEADEFSLFATGSHGRSPQQCSPHKQTKKAAYATARHALQDI
jgi:hypothetical protein